jgi:hypothetical protein
MWLFLFYKAPGICASHQPLKSTTLLLNRAGISLIPLFLYAMCFVKSIGRVTKHICHPFWADMSHMCPACEM